MIRDQGPIYNLGYGVNSRSLPRWEGSEEEQRGANPNSGVISKMLNKNPAMKFVAASAATMLVGAVATSVVRGSGVKLFSKLEDINKPWASQMISDMKSVRDQLDAFQGVTRSYGQGDPLPGQLYGRKILDNGSTAIDTGEVNKTSSYFITRDERLKALRTGRTPPAAWSMADEIQSRLVASARRMPYELPAFYLAHKTVVNPLMGGEQDPKKKVNWFNPLDVVSDFFVESAKMATTMMLPFEAGTAASKQGWRRFMTYGDDLAQPTASQQTFRTGVLSMKALLGQVGADAVDVTNKVLNFSSRSTGALSAGLNAAAGTEKGLVQYFHSIRHGTTDWAQLSAVQKAKNLVTNASLMDAAPGPFKGFTTGLRAADQEYKKILASQEAYKQFLSLGPRGFDSVAGNPVTAARKNFFAKKLETLGVLQTPSNPYGSMKEALSEHLSKTSHGMQSTVREWGLFKHGRPALTPGANTGIKNGKFYKDAIDGEYTRLLKSRLMRGPGGLDQKSADAFAASFRVASPKSGAVDDALSLTQRIEPYGKGSLGGNTEDEFFDNLLKHLRNRLPEGQVGPSARQLKDAIAKTDATFMDQGVRKMLDAKVGAQFKAIEDQILPNIAKGQLKRLPTPYDSFNHSYLSPDEIAFMQKNVARLTGLNLVAQNGQPISHDLVISHLRSAKLDPENMSVLKGILIDKKVISKPWQRDGRNIFGLKRLTLDKSVEKGIFRNGQYDESDARDLISRIAAGDPLAGAGQYGLRGAWESQTGQVLDLSIIKRGITRAVNTFASDYHIPLLKFNPLQMANWVGSQEMRDKAMFQFIPGMSNQPFLRGAKETDDFYLWMKSGHRGSKGKVFSMSTGNGQPLINELQGTYKPNSATRGVVAKHARYAIKDEGFSPNGTGPNSTMGRIKKFFDVSEDAQDSIFGYFSRARNRRFDLNNRQTFARLLSDGQIPAKGGGSLTLQQAMQDSVAFEGAAKGFIAEMGAANLSDDVVNALKNARTAAGEEFAFTKALSYDVRGRGAQFLPDEVVSLTSLKSSGQLEEFGQLISSGDKALMGSLTQEQRRVLQSAKSAYIDKYLKNAYGPGYWDKVVGKGTSSRLDAYKRDLAKYLTVRQNTLNNQEFREQLPELLTQIQRLKGTGAFNASQATEARAALMSIQYDLTAASTYARSNTTYQNLRGAIDRFVADAPVLGTQRVLQEISSGKLGTSGGLLGRVQPILRSRLGASSYDYDGIVFNPFASDTLLTPTFSSTFLPSQGGNPFRALKSVSGVSTYSDPQSFSGASVIQSHLISRLNKPFSALGMGVDPTANYKGALDLYARGLVGKRVLPIVAGGTALLTADRTIGGYANGKDQYGDRVYSPFFLGKAADAYVGMGSIFAGITPGGETSEDYKKRMETGEVPIRAGRWWALGNTPFKGGRIQYYRPNWYRRLKSGYTYTDQTYGTPMERALYGYDFSPLRAIDPYRFERKHYYDRPYPETGEYFTGPWGPLTSALNMTVGKVLKPTKMMHEQEVATGLAKYAPVGDAGAYIPPTTQFALNSVGSGSGFSYGGTTMGSTMAGVGGARITGFSSTVKTNAPTTGSTGGSVGLTRSFNARLQQAGQYSLSTGSVQAAQMVANINQQYAQAAYSPAYGTVKQEGLMDPRIIAGAPPISRSSLKFQSSQLAYEAQELAGIYGFAFGGIRRELGLGTQDYSPDRPVLASAGKAYGSTRAFWDLNIGGVGDFPLPIEGNMSNLEFSEIARRFIPKERKDVQYVNPIKNDMGIMYPWLPGSDYFINFKEGDPYTHVPEGEMRLPGKGYERFHRLNSDATGKYGLVDQFKVLGDVAPWSQEYRELDSVLDKMNLGSRQREIIQTTREQVEAKKVTNEFTPYKHTYNNDPTDSLLKNVVGRVKEKIEHSDTYFNTKFLQKRTAVEDWERDNVYGATFPEWQNPIDDFLQPMMNKSTQRGPLLAATTMGFVGSLFGKGPKAKAIGAFIGGSAGFAAGSYGKAYEAITGRQFMPASRKKEIALDEYTDILTYVKNMHLSAAAESSGNQDLAAQFMNEAKQTMYGADIYQGNLSQIAQAIPKRKREHFKAMLAAPVEERKRILDTSGRLERRIYQAAWGMPVEKRPDLEEYFSERELPEAGWEGYNPSTSMDQIKVKIGQSMGLDLSEMGYYPQQIKEANLVNASYPSFRSNTTGTAQRLRELMRAQNIQGDVIPVLTPYAGDRIELQAGLR